MKKRLVGLLFFGSSLAYAGERHPEAINQPIVDIGPGAHIKGPLVMRDARNGEVIFFVREDGRLDIEAGSTGIQLLPGR